tara:strand:+ start:27 stop:425 length:399 start_codon:yes stop_codon:yes gene_type:complete
MKFTDGKKGNPKPNLVRPLKIEIRTGKWGYGVFATEDIEKGEILEEAPILIDKIPWKADCMRNYRFSGWDTLRKERCHRMPGGMMIFVNHSEEPNAIIGQDYDWERLARLQSTKPIAKGEELFWNYGYTPKG